MKRNVIAIFALALLLTSLTSCAIIRPGEIGLRQTLGNLKPGVIDPGIAGYNFLVTKIIRIPTQTVNLEVKLSLPSREGLNINSEISILYRINPDKASQVIQNIGVNYEDVVILSVFRSAAADVCSRFYAKDMYTEGRSGIEKEIRELMTDILAPRGFEIEAVLLKSINLPQGLARAIEEKLESEQEAQRMEFVLQRERLEASRRRIEAEGIRDAQRIIEEGLSPRIIEWQSLEAFKILSTSPNTKIIITDGKAPMLIDPVSN
ncbi:MAG: prohibitin family protein [Bacteroidia bacterium]|jgi:regulator of protease activity HflC (stomatin/prohibitin superfamily)|nr:prohibitin family protein [Bacteroidia bacterium]